MEQGCCHCRASHTLRAHRRACVHSLTRGAARRGGSDHELGHHGHAIAAASRGSQPEPRPKSETYRRTLDPGDPGPAWAANSRSSRSSPLPPRSRIRYFCLCVLVRLLTKRSGDIAYEAKRRDALPRCLSEAVQRVVPWPRRVRHTRRPGAPRQASAMRVAAGAGRGGVAAGRVRLLKARRGSIPATPRPIPA